MGKNKVSINKITLIAAIIVFAFGVVPQGVEVSKWLLEYSPVLFYSIFVPLASIFGVWIITEVKKRVK